MEDDRTNSRTRGKWQYDESQGGAAYPNRPQQSGSGGREVCFEEPEILVEFARELCKQIRSDRITEVIGLLDGRAQRVGVMSHVVHKELQHRRAVRGRQ